MKGGKENSAVVSSGKRNAKILENRRKIYVRYAEIIIYIIIAI